MTLRIIQKIENLEKDPENYSIEYFEELKRQGVEVETWQLFWWDYAIHWECQGELCKDVRRVKEAVYRDWTVERGVDWFGR